MISKLDISCESQPGLASEYWPNDHGFTIDAECISPVKLEVVGRIPDYCRGTLYTIGPGKQTLSLSDSSTISAKHWFDGFAQIHRFNLTPSSESSSPSPSPSLNRSHESGDERREFRQNVDVFYNSRQVLDPVIEKFRRTGTTDIFSFAGKYDPCQTYFQKVSSIFSPILSTPGVGESWSSNVNVNVFDAPRAIVSSIHGSDKAVTTKSSDIPSIITSTDANAFQTVDRETLKPIHLSSQSAVNPKLKGPMCATHPEIDPENGDLYNYNLDFKQSTLYQIYRTCARDGKTEILAAITDAPPAYIHSFFLTPHFVVLCVWGSRFAWGGMKVLYTHNIVDAIDSQSLTHDCRWYVIDRTASKRGVVATYTSPSFFAFHSINAYEEPSDGQEDGESVDIVADVACYDDLSVLKKFYYDNLLATPSTKQPKTTSETEQETELRPARPQIRRFRLPRVPHPLSESTKSSWTSILSPLTSALWPALAPMSIEPIWRASDLNSVELPTVNPRFRTRKYRYIYGLSDRGESTFFDGITKFDCESQSSLRWSQRGHTPCEPVFIPDPRFTGSKNSGHTRSKTEDLGTILSVVLNGFERTSYLLALNAKDMKEIGRAELDRGIAFTFHGTHTTN